MGSKVDWLAGGTRQDLARSAIHQAARQQLLDGGLNRFTAESVARRAGCSRATLYRVAGGKRALLDAVLASGAAEIATRIAAEVAGLSGEERVVQAIVIGLREVRADPVVIQWVRETALSGDFLQSSSDLSALAGQLSSERHVSPLEGVWIVRVFLQFVVWPAPELETEEALVRQFVGPLFR